MSKTRKMADELYETNVGIQRTIQTHMTWDQRRQLAIDISNLAPPDLSGVLLIIRNYGQVLEMRELLPHKQHVLPWEEHVQDNVQLIPRKENWDNIQLQCSFRLDHADDELLQQLRQYVDDCYIPHFVPKENCNICEGLWSCGRIVYCGNDACPIRVHEECFGVVLREQIDGPWRCPSCLLGKQLVCAVCMQYGGPLKPLTMSESSSGDEQKWVHVLCALAIPELLMRDVPTMEPVDGFEEIDNGRFRYLCAICRKRGGASVICEAEGCNVGVHPLCAADAGLMIGNEGNLLGVYCDKHLPTSRIPGAKRWISDEDLVEEIMSEYSIDEDFDADDSDTLRFSDTERYAFVLESTPYYHCQQQLLGSTATFNFGPAPFSAIGDQTNDIDRKTFFGTKITANAYVPPAMVVQNLKTQRPMLYPPPTLSSRVMRLGLPEFPKETHLVGAIVEYSTKAKDEWLRARVVQWDKEKKEHLVHLIASDQKLWTKLNVENSLILYLPDEVNLVDGPIVKLIRPVINGIVQWRPKPRQFAPASP
ncbi:related to nto1-component of the histone acetyltransferase complex [Plasmopara halstedii]|uniref:Related to nto1-component of the histone acetyltransferase complex n=1 Tax=Plasmopara halstedii TaxID=4781 RepID=A0A0P1AHG4_PLAHL|nr:related to nto1-component of the histone acetyltransferase complex [Plasmopara halstedii]CEG40118.1 related to nto1-component of the histone acetyltransferase complex [Plasmopara halstedii]|eukprot:XP_024576487.1 related to nto1-component of the histone acetyltransferase complex [Plasmopara halstedii]